MGGALLVDGLGEAVVHGPAVMHQTSPPINSQQAFGHLAAARGVDFVADRIGSGKHVQPGLAAAYTPAGLVGREFLGGPDVVANLLIRRLRAPRRAQAGTDRGGAADLLLQAALGGFPRAQGLLQLLDPCSQAPVLLRQAPVLFRQALIVGQKFSFLRVHNADQLTPVPGIYQHQFRAGKQTPDRTAPRPCERK